MTTRKRLAVAVLFGIVVVAAVVGVAAFFVVRHVLAAFDSTFKSAGIDNQFGDQWLKSAVAQIELHKLRYGKYPKSLKELRFLSPMDMSVLYNVAYYPNADLTAYYVEVRTGFFRKPTLEYPEEFWRGTGFRKELRPAQGTSIDDPKPHPRLQPSGHGPAGG